MLGGAGAGVAAAVGTVAWFYYATRGGDPRTRY